MKRLGGEAGIRVGRAGECRWGMRSGWRVESGRVGELGEEHGRRGSDWSGGCVYELIHRLGIERDGLVGFAWELAYSEW